MQRLAFFHAPSNFVLYALIACWFRCKIQQILFVWHWSQRNGVQDADDPSSSLKLLVLKQYKEKLIVFQLLSRMLDLLMSFACRLNHYKPFLYNHWNYFESPDHKIYEELMLFTIYISLFACVKQLLVRDAGMHWQGT